MIASYLSQDEGDLEVDVYAKKGKPDFIDAHIGEQIRRRRTLLGLTQKELANAVEVSVQQLQKYEKATNRVSGSKLYQLSNILRVPLDFFYEGLNYISEKLYKVSESQTEYNAEDLEEREIITLIRAFKKIEDQEMRMKLINIARVFAKQD